MIMSRMISSLRFRFVLLALCIADANIAFACSCSFIPESSILENSSIAFEGQIIDIRTDGVRQTTRLRVLKVLKGSAGDSVVIYTHTVGAMCGYDFRERRSPLLTVAVYGEPNHLSTNSCTMFILNRWTR
jgi:hypothetical protein